MCAGAYGSRGSLKAPRFQADCLQAGGKEIANSSFSLRMYFLIDSGEMCVNMNLKARVCVNPSLPEKPHRDQSSRPVASLRPCQVGFDILDCAPPEVPSVGYLKTQTLERPGL